MLFDHADPIWLQLFSVMALGLVTGEIGVWIRTA
jgi:hypothetical protein